MNSLTNLEAAEKIIYLEIIDYNEKWSTRAIRGFADDITRQTLRNMFEERYHSIIQDKRLIKKDLSETA